ncbi:MAG: 30S ribosomal protein S12 methylthiotransferase RimO [Bdellovibrionaceae bacterium]|jgi:ribosomal protein S12 methylthiotransferase|nr:30S ribosomal protein S12 methylthiotransferase RimO [Pseudobdellovibrionaceae bacterium]
MNTVHFISLGCPKNLVDSEIMLATLQNENYQVVELPEEAEVIVVNTCGFIEDSKQESLQAIFDMAEFKKKGKLKKLVMAGCLTQRYKEELVKELPEVDLFVGSGAFQDLPKILKDHNIDKTKKSYFHQSTFLQQESTPRQNSQPSHRAYLKISEGCKKLCAFCAIPMIRGGLQSRTIKSIVSEAKLLVAGGVKEIIVISHDFTDYGWDLRKKQNLPDETPYELLKALSEQSGAQWIRVLYQYPDALTDEMIQLFKEKSNLLNYFDMPLQHINDGVLQKMNRRMDKQKIQDVVNKIRKKMPDAVIRTQFIVGFPGETEEAFNELLDFVEMNKFEHVGCFQYSKEEGTKAASFESQIENSVKEQRFNELMALQKEISYEAQQGHLGKTYQVLVDGVSEESELLLQGRTFFQGPDIDGLVYINDGKATKGDMVSVEITESHDYDLVGHII